MSVTLMRCVIADREGGLSVSSKIGRERGSPILAIDEFANYSSPPFLMGSKRRQNALAQPFVMGMPRAASD